MRRNLRVIPSLLITLRGNMIHFNNAYQHPFPLLSISPNLSYLNSPHSSIPRHAIYAPFTTTSIGGQEDTHSDPDHESDTDPDEEVHPYQTDMDPDFKTIMDILRTSGAHEMSQKLDQSGANPTPGLVTNVLSATRNEWETAFTFFLWAGKHSGYSHSRREYHSMISVLGKFRKFDTAWALIDNDMRSSSLVSPHTLLIMMRKYAAAHDVAKAINAFYALRRFKFKIGMDEFQGLLSSLSRYKNAKDAEHLLFCNASVFPLNTKSFNIVLNGWCNVIGSLREGKRIWKEMETRGIKHDVYSYSSIMSCLSKANKLNVVLRLYGKMKALGIKPDRKAYNAVIHALAKGRLINEARSLVRKMEVEGGVVPDSVTYNSLIKPLCMLRMLDQAKQVFDEMTIKGLVPTVRTYHAFFRALRTGDEVFELLGRMRGAGCHPSHDTYIMLIRKFCRWRQIELVFKVLGEMGENGLDPDRSTYIVLIHGLFLNGRLEEAHKYYLEMKEKGLLPEPKIDSMIQAWVAGNGDADRPVTELTNDQSLGDKVKNKSKKNQRGNDFHPQPEVRIVTREKGFSFWNH